MSRFTKKRCFHGIRCWHWRHGRCKFGHNERVCDVVCPYGITCRDMDNGCFCKHYFRYVPLKQSTQCTNKELILKERADFREVYNCADVLGEVLKYTNRENFLDVMVISHDVRGFFMSGRYKVYFFVNLPSVPIGCKFVVNAGIRVVLSMVSSGEEFNRIPENEHIAHIKFEQLNLRGFEKTFDLKKFKRLERITLYTHKLCIFWDFRMESTGNVSIVFFNTFYFSDMRKKKVEVKNVLTFIGHGPLTITLH